MKICKIILKGVQQFQDTVLDFTHPETGEPLNRICLIGQNGTGKSTILRLLDAVLFNNRMPQGFGGHAVVQLSTAVGLVYYLPFKPGSPNILSADIDEKHPGWFERYHEKVSQVDDMNPGRRFDLSNELFLPGGAYNGFSIEGDTKQEILAEFSATAAPTKLQIYSPAEAPQNTYNGVNNLPGTTLNDALQLMKKFPVRHVVSKATVADMWKTLVYLIKQRESEQQAFEVRSENIDLTKRELLERFDRENPDILVALGAIWNRILDHANLEFDVEGAKIPVQLTDNLEAYIRLKRNGGARIPYSQLSKGIRDFLFRIGHIFLLYYGREVRQAFLMVDEPENSLFPDFLFDLMELYQEIANPGDAPDRTQMFFATHNPIVAAQFEPHERIVLEWQDDGYVTAHKGIAPAGDDPNDVLRQDFEMSELMGRAGRENWDKYLRLKKQARHESDPEKKNELILKAQTIGNAYNFPAKRS